MGAHTTTINYHLQVKEEEAIYLAAQTETRRFCQIRRVVFLIWLSQNYSFSKHSQLAAFIAINLNVTLIDFSPN